MENRIYEKVDPEDIIMKLKEILAYLQKNRKLNLENGENISDPPKN